MKTAANIILGVKQAKPRTPTAQTITPQEVNRQQDKDVGDNNAEPQTARRLTATESNVNQEQVVDSGFNHLVGVKVTGEMLDRLEAAVVASGMTKAVFLRAIIERSLV